MSTGSAYGCERCMPPDPAAARAVALTLEHATSLVDDSHFIASVRGCRACGQRFLQVFAEAIDWRDGEDPQWRALVPVSLEEAIALVGLDAAGVERAFCALPAGRPCLVFHSPASGEATVDWTCTPVPVMPHD